MDFNCKTYPFKLVYRRSCSYYFNKKHQYQQNKRRKLCKLFKKLNIIYQFKTEGKIDVERKQVHHQFDVNKKNAHLMLNLGDQASTNLSSKMIAKVNASTQTYFNSLHVNLLIDFVRFNLVQFNEFHNSLNQRDSNDSLLWEIRNQLDSRYSYTPSFVTDKNIPPFKNKKIENNDRNNSCELIENVIIDNLASNIQNKDESKLINIGNFVDFCLESSKTKNNSTENKLKSLDVLETNKQNKSSNFGIVRNEMFLAELKKTLREREKKL
jgi:hypothetical protein